MKYFLLVVITAFIFSCDADTDKIGRAKKMNEEALQFLDEGKDSAARELFLAAATTEGVSDKDKSIYIKNIAISYLTKKDSAIYYFKWAAKLSGPDTYGYNVNTAYIYLEKDETDSAINYLQKAYGQNSSGLTVNNLLGLIYMGEYGMDYYNPDKAYRYNFECYDVFKDEGSKFALAKNFYYLGKYEKAVQFFKELYKEFPTNGNYLVNQIMILQENEAYTQVNSLFKKLKKDHPEKYEELIKDKPLVGGTHTLSWNNK